MIQRALKRAGRSALTTTKIEALRPKKRRYEVTDSVARGLQLRIERSGRKLWLHRYSWNDESVRLTLDDYEHLGLLEARGRIKINQDLLHRGIDPRTAQPHRRTSSKGPAPARPLPSLQKKLNQPGEPSQASVAPEVLPPGWPTDPQSLELLRALTPFPTGSRHSVEFLIFEFFLLFIVPGRKDKGGVARMLRVDILQHWKTRDARTITPREVIQRLDAIVQRGARVMANRVAATLHQLFLHGVHRATIESSPVQLLFPPGGKEVSRTRALSDEEIGRFLAHRFEICPTEWLARALTVLLLTAVRRVELCLAKWEHIDFEKREWRIPVEHTKSRRAFLVYLTERLVAEFSALKRLSRGSAYVLPHKELDRPVTRSALTGSVYRSLWRFQLFGIAPFTPHDLRRTCRTGMARIGVRRFVARRFLNHKQRGVDGVYDLHEYFKQKRRALRRWTNHCVGLESAALQAPRSLQSGTGALSDGSLKIEDLPRRKMNSLTRGELYDLVWTSPMRTLCKRFEISNVWLAKICRRHRIPVPPRGYWAKRHAGIDLPPAPLPLETGDSPSNIQICGKDHVGKSRISAHSMRPEVATNSCMRETLHLSAQIRFSTDVQHQLLPITLTPTKTFSTCGPTVVVMARRDKY